MCHVGAYCGRYTIVVDDDIDVSNLEELIWAVLTRSDPATSIDIIRNAWSTPLDPRIEPERKAAGDYTNSRAIIDACRPWHWRDKFHKVYVPTPEPPWSPWPGPHSSVGNWSGGLVAAGAPGFVGQEFVPLLLRPPRLVDAGRGVGAARRGPRE